MPATTRRRGQPAPDKEIFQLFTTLNHQQCEEQNDLTGIFEGRLRSHAQNFEGMKRKWEGFTGGQLPKKLRMSVDPSSGVSSVAQNASKPAAAKSAQEPIRAASVPQTTAAATMPVHADDKINVDNMIVNNLRKELKRRGLSAAGRKAELQKRLREYLTESRQRREADWAKQMQEAEEKIKAVKIHEWVVQEKQPMDVVMEEVEEEGTESAAEEAEVVTAPQPSFKSHSVAPKSALKPSKYTANKQSVSPDGVRQEEENKQEVKELTAPPTQQHVNPPPVKVSEESKADSSVATVASSTTSTTLQASAQKSKITTLVETPSGAAFKTKPSGAGSTKLIEKKKLHAAQSEARKARMAEMRQKAKPTVGSATKSVTGSQSKYAASAALKKMASSSATAGQSSKSTDILAKMREKAAAKSSNNSSHQPVIGSAKSEAQIAFAPPSLRHANNSMVAEQGSLSSSSATSVKKIAAKFAPPVSAAAKNPSHKSKAKYLAPSPVASSQPTKLKTNAKALKSLNDPANKPKPVVVKPTKKPVAEKPLSPKQTYEMSDREEESVSESDSDSEYERQRPKKTVPQWAQKSNLMRALEKQYADGPNRLDPDKIFGEVLSCNLDEIFDKKKARYQRRTSSGNWSQDHVTAKEKLAYKRAVFGPNFLP